MTASLVEQIAALAPYQRATVDRIRVRVEGPTPVAEVTWMGMFPALDPGEGMTGWVKADPIRIELDPTSSVEDQLADLDESGILGHVVADRLGESGDVAPRWSAQAWVGADGKGMAVSDESSAMADVLSVDADLRLARWRTRQVEERMQAAVATAMDDGVRTALVAAALGLSLPRVYQIRDGRR